MCTCGGTEGHAEVGDMYDYKHVKVYGYMFSYTLICNEFKHVLLVVTLVSAPRGRSELVYDLVRS